VENDDFSLPSPRLSEAQIASFKNDGFVILPGGFDANASRRIGAWTTELAAMPEVSGKQWVYHEQSRLDPDEQLICRIENIAPFHPGFAALSRALAGPMAQLLGEESVLFKEKVNFKMPGGDGFKPHQDSQAGWGDYADYFISVMVCIDEATIENGCLQMVKGHQHSGLYREWEPLTDEDMADMDFQFYPTQPGDVVFFDCYTPHSSEPNLSDRIRRMYFATYNRLSEGDHLARYYADKRASYPPDIEREQGREYVFRV